MTTSAAGPAEPSPFDHCHDVIVVGSGGAGLTAGLAAAVAGLEVVVLESSGLIGGTTAMSGAGTWIPANHKARDAGIRDSRQSALAYIRASAPPGWQKVEDPLWRRFVVEAPAMMKFVEDTTPLVFDLIEEADPYPLNPGACRTGRMLSPRPLPPAAAGGWSRRIRVPHVPHILTYQEMRRHDAWHRPLQAVFGELPAVAARLATGSRAQGTALVRGLVGGFIRAGGSILTDARAVELTTDSNRDVTGVRVERGGEAIRLRARRGVVLACGGFERDEERRRAHFPGPIDFIASAPSNLGDGHRMAEAAGAELARMDQANIAPAIPARVRGLALPLGTFHHREPSALLIGRDGRRFANEYLFNLGEVLLQRDPATGGFAHLPAWLVADAALLRASPVMNHFLRADRTFVRRAGDLGELAAQIGVPGDVLKATVLRFNGFAAMGTDPDFGRHLDPLSVDGLAPGRLAPLVEPPYVAMPFNLSFLSTKGGPRTDSRGQVLRADGSAIGGLYCAGVAMANPFGSRAVGQGTTIGPNMTWGWICGRALTGELPEHIELEGEHPDA